MREYVVICVNMHVFSRMYSILSCHQKFPLFPPVVSIFGWVWFRDVSLTICIRDFCFRYRSVDMDWISLRCSHTKKKRHLKQQQHLFPATVSWLFGIIRRRHCGLFFPPRDKFQRKLHTGRSVVFQGTRKVMKLLTYYKINLISPGLVQQQKS